MTKRLILVVAAVLGIALGATASSQSHIGVGLATTAVNPAGTGTDDCRPDVCWLAPAR
jgi:hypothetical protein